MKTTRPIENTTSKRKLENGTRFFYFARSQTNEIVRNDMYWVRNSKDANVKYENNLYVFIAVQIKGFDDLSYSSEGMLFTPT